MGDWLQFWSERVEPESSGAASDLFLLGIPLSGEAIPGREPALALSSLTLSERFVASGGAIDETARPLRANHHWDTRPWCSAVAAIMSQAPKTCTCTRIFCRPPRLHASEL